MTTFTREDYEMAAKAAGIDGWYEPGYLSFIKRGGGVWRPPEDDGDTQRLAVRLRLSLRYYSGLIDVCVHTNRGARTVVSYRLAPQDESIEESARLATFRAAIAIGRAMP